MGPASGRSIPGMLGVDYISSTLKCIPIRGSSSRKKINLMSGRSFETTGDRTKMIRCQEKILDTLFHLLYDSTGDRCE